MGAHHESLPSISEAWPTSPASGCPSVVPFRGRGGGRGGRHKESGLCAEDADGGIKGRERERERDGDLVSTPAKHRRRRRDRRVWIANVSTPIYSGDARERDRNFYSRYENATSRRNE